MTEAIKPPVGSTPLEKYGHTTYHLTPVDYWESRREGEYYLPEQFDDDGFIHCTDTIAEVIAVGNRYFQGDSRAFVLLEVDCVRVSAPIVYEDPGQIFPHIYGAVEVAAVQRAFPVERTVAGEFLAVDGRAQ